jgi:hypothetical protein
MSSVDCLSGVWCKLEDQGAQIQFGSVRSPCLVVFVFLHSSLFNSLPSLLVTVRCWIVFPLQVFDHAFGSRTQNEYIFWEFFLDVNF